MSLLEDFLNQASDEVDKNLKTGEWFDKLTEEANKKTEEIENDVLKSSTEHALDVLKSHKNDIVKMDKKSLTLFVSRLAIGDEKKATLEYIKNHATIDELISGMEEDADTVINTKNEEEAFKEEVVNLIKNIGLVSVKLLPLLLAL